MEGLWCEAQGDAVVCHHLKDPDSQQAPKHAGSQSCHDNHWLHLTTPSPELNNLPRGSDTQPMAELEQPTWLLVTYAYAQPIHLIGALKVVLCHHVAHSPDEEVVLCHHVGIQHHHHLSLGDQGACSSSSSRHVTGGTLQQACRAPYNTAEDASNS